MRLTGCLLALLLVGPAWAQFPDLESGPRLGLILDAERAEALPRVQEGSVAPFVRLTARWDEVEGNPGAYAWGETPRAAEVLASKGYRVVVCLTGSHPHWLPEGGQPHPLVGESFQAWLAFVRDAARVFGGRAEVFQIRERFGGDDEAYAFLLKNSVLALRAVLEAAGQRAAVAQAAISGAGGLAWQRRLWERDVAAYVDILPVAPNDLDDPERVAEEIGKVLKESVFHPPAARVWAYLRADDSESARDAIGAGIVALVSGASAALSEPAVEDDGPIHWVVGMQKLLAQGYAPAPAGDLVLESAGGAAAARAGVLGRFFSDADFSTLVVYRNPGEGSSAAATRIRVDGAVVRNTRVEDPATGEVSRVRTLAADSGRAIQVTSGPYPLALRFERGPVSPGFELPPEAVETTGSRELTAEEIIARYQQVQKIQDDRLERWMARGRQDFHFQLGQAGGTIDFSVESNYFWERGGQLEWEQTEYFFNGTKVRWKKIPKLPLIQPEKVITLPLDLTLDRTYGYRRVGRGKVDGREAYILAFEPTDPESATSLYRGRVWIDAETFVRLKASVVQTRLEAPVLSNEEVDRFLPHVGPDGETYWLMTRADGQQLWSAGGRNFVVRRELTIFEVRINPDENVFQASRSEAYASQHTMMRDTAAGFRYLDREEDGSRTVREKINKSFLFLGGGVFKDNATDLTPLAGVNYFNYGVKGTDVQFNVFFAGVFAFMTGSKPGLFGSKADATADLGLMGIKVADKLFLGTEELLLERIDQRSQTLSLRFGMPFGQFYKFTAIGTMRYLQYFQNEDAQEARAVVNAESPQGVSLDFILPPDHLQTTGTGLFEFNRRGWQATARFSVNRRSDWRPWGLYDNLSGQFIRCNPICVPYENETSGDGFYRWGVAGFKEWYLPKFQKVRADLSYLDGRDLDRFSRYQFSFFGQDRLAGFSGSGIRFDRGVIGRTGYSFNILEAVRLDAALQSALVEPPEGGDRQSHTGIGLSGSITGPWKTVISLDYGYSLASDIPDLEGNHEFMLLIFKLF